MKIVAASDAFAVAADRWRSGCSSDDERPSSSSWVEDEVTFAADGLTIHGTYRHQKDAAPGPAALLISESGNTDRNGDNAVVGPIGNMRQLAELPVRPGRREPALRQGRHRQDRARPVRSRTPTTSAAPSTPRRQGRGALPRRPAGHRQVPHLGVRARRGHRPRDGAGRRTPRPARRRSTRSACCSRCPVATSTSSPTGCAPTPAPRRWPPGWPPSTRSAPRAPCPAKLPGGARRDPQPGQRRRPSSRPTRSTRWRWPPRCPRARRCC